jgi:hypothetical protein
MTNYVVVPSTTAQTLPTIASSVGVGMRFDQIENTASTFTMLAGSLLEATGPGNNAVQLFGSAPWTATIDGTLKGANVALFFGPGTAMTTVNLSSSATLTGVAFSGLFSDRPMTLDNKGLIQSTFFSAINLGGLNALNTITNSGTIKGFDVAIDSGANGLDTVLNKKTGFISGDIELRGGNDKLTNEGGITGNVDLGEGNNTLSNAKVISGGGEGSIFVRGGEGDDNFSNSKDGIIDGYIFLGGGGEGGNSFKNAGVLRGFVEGGSAVDKVTNSGTIERSIQLFGGNDVLINTGTIEGVVNLGSGEDIYKGGKFTDRVFDAEGSDKYSLGAGDDTFAAFFGGGEETSKDVVDGGKGRDLYFASFASGGLSINLDDVNHEGKTGMIAARSAFLNGATLDDRDTIKGFEGVSGSGFNDEIFGRNKGADQIDGGGGVDYLWGLGGNDILSGGGGGDEANPDHIIGGMGADLLVGTAESNDHFVYFNAKESGPTAKTRDTIFNFDPNQDMIEFNGQLIGKFTTLLATDAAFTGAAGQLHVLTTTTGWLIEGDINGDKKADISIAVDDADHSTGWAFIPNVPGHGDILI